MLEALIIPLQLAAFVVLALTLGRKGESALWQRLRPVLLLIFNVLILGWVLGTWKGLAFYAADAALCGWAIRRLGPSVRRPAWRCAGVVTFLVLALLAGKYILPHDVRGALAIRQVWSTISLSFLTFRMIHVALDAHAGLIPKVEWLTLLNYFFFAPVSVAGPIQKYLPFEKNLRDPEPLSPAAFVAAIQRMVLGVAKKVLIAGPLTPYILGNMEPCGAHSLLMLAAACLLYSIYIYADFSGYTDIAIGGAALMGIILPENFNRPWLSVNLQDFWNRWHMTLTDWLRTYLFYPTTKVLVQRFPGGARRVDPMIAILITFALAGLWHGNTWGFLIFGLMHGAGIAFHFLIRKKGAAPGSMSAPRTLLARSVTIGYVSLAWIPFVYPLGEIPWLLGQILR